MARRTDTVLQTYLREIDEVPLLSKEEEIKLAKRIRRNDAKARELMIRANLRLVVSVAKKYTKRGLPLLDLIAEGNLGLMHAVERYDPAQGTRVSTYATWWIKQAVRRALASKSKTIHIPAYMVELLAKWKRMETQLIERLGRQPTAEEIADKLKIPPKRIPIVRRALRAASTSAAESADLTWMFEDVLADERTVPPDEAALDSYEKALNARGSLKVSDRVRNGSMLNPPARQEVAYDSGIRNWFRPPLAARLPVRMKPGDSLVSTISLKVGEVTRTPYTGQRRGTVHKRGEVDNSPVKTAAVLTCMAQPQPADAFRPAYCDTANKVYLARNLKRHLLRNLPRPVACCRVEGASLKRHLPRDPPRPENMPKMDKWIRVFERPWVNTGFFGFEQPMENMPHYEQWIGQAMSMAGLMLMLDFPPEEKERLLVRVAARFIWPSTAAPSSESLPRIPSWISIRRMTITNGASTSCRIAWCGTSTGGNCAPGKLPGG